MARMHGDPQDEVAGMLADAEAASWRAKGLTEQLLTFARGGMPVRRTASITHLLKDSTSFALSGANLGCEYSLPEGLWPVDIDEGQMSRVMQNLVLNAKQAMPEGGRLTLRTEALTLDAADCRDRPEAVPGRFIRLSVTDTGVGIDDDTLQHLFEPFFSTKSKGSGLGLSIARNLVRQYGGWVEASSTFGRGSTFQVYLPALEEDEEARVWERRALSTVRGAGQHILLVEDDEGVRGAVSEMLRLGGYTVTSAVSAAHARGIFAEQGPFDLVFSDVVLPDRDGLQLVDEFRIDHPGLPVLLTSGYPDERAQWPLIQERGYGFLRKPFSLGELLLAIRAAIGG